jgi:hypothetical protein
VEAKQAWYYGATFSEGVELLLVFSLFIAVLAVVWFLQRHIGDH